MIPNDPFMLLSYINTQLRDHYPTLEDLGEGLDISVEEIIEKLKNAGFIYNADTNRFIAK